MDTYDVKIKIISDDGKFNDNNSFFRLKFEIVQSFNFFFQLNK